VKQRRRQATASFRQVTLATDGRRRISAARSTGATFWLMSVTAAVAYPPDMGTQREALAGIVMFEGPSRHDQAVISAGLFEPGQIMRRERGFADSASLHGAIPKAICLRGRRADLFGWLS
jgi:hypothetical protein